MKSKIEYYTEVKNGVRFMECKCCSTMISVSDSTTAIKCDICVREDYNREFPFTPPKRYVSSGRPRGWKFMKEFVHTDGTVFHKGVEQPKLKGTLPHTPKPEPKKKLTKQEKEDLKNKLAQQMVFVRGELANAKWKKDERRYRIDLKKIERQLKKLN